MERREKKGHPLIGVAIGAGYMILGLLSIAYPELAGTSTPSGRPIAIFLGALLFIAGLLGVLYYIVAYRKEDKNDS